MGFLFWRKKKDKDAPQEQPVEVVEAPEVAAQPEPVVEAPVTVIEPPVVEPVVEVLPEPVVEVVPEPKPEPTPEPAAEVVPEPEPELIYGEPHLCEVNEYALLRMEAGP